MRLATSLARPRQVKELEKSGRKKDFRQAIILDEACAACFRTSSSQ